MDLIIFGIFTLYHNTFIMKMVLTRQLRPFRAAFIVFDDFGETTLSFALADVRRVEDGVV
jgi:hypothetical protein